MGPRTAEEPTPEINPLFFAGSPTIAGLARRVVQLTEAGRRDEAWPLAEQCLTLLLNPPPARRRFRVHLLPQRQLGVADRAHIRVEVAGRDCDLAVPLELVGTNFANFGLRFQAVRTLCCAASAVGLADGHAVWDLRDASAVGDYPRIAFCSNLDVAHLVTDPHFLYHKGFEGLRSGLKSAWVPWRDRRPIVFWRGGANGIMRYAPERKEPVDDWSWLQRLHLCAVARRSPHRSALDIAVTDANSLAGEDDDFWIKAVESAGFLRPRCAKRDFLNYRYLIDIDGYSNTWIGLFSAMLMGATILKIASPFGYRQWYYDRLVAWRHYIPVKADLRDFDDKVEWALSHDAQCAAMGRAAAALAGELTYRTQLRHSAEVVAAALRAPHIDRAQPAPSSHSKRDSAPNMSEAATPPHVTTLETSSPDGLIGAVKEALNRAIRGEGKLPPDVLAIPGMSGRKYRNFINCLIEKTEEPRYLEIGVLQGSTFCAAIYKNNVRALAIDNWAQFGAPANRFFGNLTRFKEPGSQVSFLETDFRQVDFAGLGKFNIYFFDGPHEERDQRDGVVLAEPALDDRFVLIVDDWNWKQVRDGTFRGIHDADLRLDYFAEIRTSVDDRQPQWQGPKSDWHNGCFIAVCSKP